MGLRTTTEAIAIKRATEIADLYIAKFNSLVNSTAQSNLGTVESISGPNKFKVKINGQVREITYLGTRPIAANGTVIVDGNFAK